MNTDSPTADTGFLDVIEALQVVLHLFHSTYYNNFLSIEMSEDKLVLTMSHLDPSNPK